MADNAEGSATKLSFKVKTSGDGLHSITIGEFSTVLDLKTKLSGEDYENISVDRMRLIYSGRVMKNEEPLSTYKIKNGNTIHMVKSAASNPTPANTSAAASTLAQPAVPPNMSAGTSANNPLDHLTGARYAGFANLPSADLFGPNGGMGAPPSMDEVADMLSNPQSAQLLNEAMSNPGFLDMMIENNPMLRNLPNAREILQQQLPTIRHLMSDPEAMRNMMRMRSMFEGGMPGAGGAGGAGGFPAPGATDTSGSNPASGGQQANPFAGLMGGNPFLNPFGAQPPSYARSTPGTGGAASPGAAISTPGANTTASSGGATAGSNDSNTGAGAGATGASQPQAGSPGAAQANPFAALFSAMNQAQGGAGAGAAGSPGVGAGQNPPMNPFMADPQAMQNMLQNLGLGGGAAAAPADNRPPEERYADQLRQLNDMGFTDFDSNVTALRRSGGSVQGAIEYLLSG
ncbi:ubiquitin-domain-containing protein [Zalerion maritima]|uniref:Ubiquitin-domain-containing protein n=1 Tax=Zalerion maritima TaxID=339359 RepID=A0AAD5RHL1_9PEZI|nr:ubiquitin-domain-containing protein [Zalerion maritima]